MNATLELSERECQLLTLALAKQIAILRALAQEVPSKWSDNALSMLEEERRLLRKICQPFDALVKKPWEMLTVEHLTQGS